MSAAAIALAAAVFLTSSIIGAITGGMSLVNVPVLMLLHVAPREAVATNLFALTFMSAAAALRFRREKLIDWRLALPLCAVTLVTSAVGARLTVWVSERTVKAIVAASMLSLLLFMLARGRRATEPPSLISTRRRVVSWLAVLVLGVYGGLFSGGYTTLLTFVCVVGLGVPLIGAVALTKVVNAVSCAAASAVYLQAGAVELRLGAILAGAGIVGGWLGANLAVKRGVGFVRGLFLAMVAALAIKLAIDLFG